VSDLAAWSENRRRDGQAEPANARQDSVTPACGDWWYEVLVGRRESRVLGLGAFAHGGHSKSLPVPSWLLTSEGNRGERGSDTRRGIDTGISMGRVQRGVLANAVAERAAPNRGGRAVMQPGLPPPRRNRSRRMRSPRRSRATPHEEVRGEIGTAKEGDVGL
jgi:hypothetical protein